MATYRKRGNAWRVEIYKAGIRKSASFDTKVEAKEWAAQMETDIKLGNKTPSALYTLRDALERYADEVSPKKKGARWEIVRIRKMLTYPFADLKLSELSSEDFANWRDMRLNEVAHASVRREMNILSAMFSVCVDEWGWLNESPMRKVKKPAGAKARDRRISGEEIEKILDALGYEGEIETKTQLVAAYFLIALETGMRLGEIASINEGGFFAEQRYVLLSDTKNADARKVPLSKKAMKLFKDVFESGLTISSESASTLFRRARERTGIQDMTFHDTRHEALTRLAGKLSVLELARMIGHRDPRSLMIYYNATPLELAAKLD